MLHLTGKLVAIFIAIWLPLFSGNALAMSVAMQTMDRDCHSAVVQQHEHHMHNFQSVQHTQPAADHQSACHQDSQNSDSDDCGICHLACCGYMATVSIKVAEAQPFSQLYSASSAQFESIALTLLDPPPLARV